MIGRYHQCWYVVGHMCKQHLSHAKSLFLQLDKDFKIVSCCLHKSSALVDSWEGSHINFKRQSFGLVGGNWVISTVTMRWKAQIFCSKQN